MITRLVFATAFLLGVAAVVTMGLNFIDADALALTVTVVIGTVYAIGAVELLQFRRATANLGQALADLSEETAARFKALDEWLIRLPLSLQHPVRRRVEGERAALPAPVLTPYLVSLLVMLGLLGTFVGLVETLKGVVVALEGSSDLDAIRRALTAPMGGLELAFGTSVAGVAASAMLGLMSILSRRERMVTVRALDDKAAGVLRRFSLAYRQQETLEALRSQSRDLPEVADRLASLADSLERMGDRLGDRLTENQSGFHDAVKDMYGELAVSVNRSLSDSVARTDEVLAQSGRLVGESIQPVVRQTMADISAEIGQSVRDTHRRLNETVAAQLRTLSEDFARTSGEVARAWQDGVAAHGQSSDALVGDMRAALVGFQEAFAGTSERLLEALRRTTTEWSERQEAADQSRLAGWTDALRQAREQGDEALERTAGGILDELRAAAAAQRESMQGVSRDMTAVAGELSVRLRESGDQAAARQSEAAAALDASARSVAQAAQAESARLLAEMQALLQASVSLVESRQEAEQTWREGQEQRLERLTAALREELSALRDAEDRRGQAAVQRLADLEATAATHLTGLGQALEQPMSRLIETASETPRAAAEVIGQLSKEISNNIERDNRLLEERGRLMAELDGLSASLARSTAEQAAAIDDLVRDAGERLSAVGERFSAQVGDEFAKVAGVADQFALSAADIASLGEAFKLAVEQYGESNGKLIESLARIEQGLENAGARSDQQLGYYVAQAREVIDYSVLTQKEIFDELRRLKLNGAQAHDAAPDGAGVS